MEKELDKLINIAIKEELNENIISEIIFLYFKDDKKIIENYDKIRIKISEDIFNLFINIANDYDNNAKKFNINSNEWKINKEKYINICNLALKLKDAKFKDKIMKSYIIRNKSQ